MATYGLSLSLFLSLSLTLTLTLTLSLSLFLTLTLTLSLSLTPSRTLSLSLTLTPSLSLVLQVNGIWWEANLAIEQTKLKRPLSRMETIKLRRKLGCDGEDASTHVLAHWGSDTCVVGPPNIGYPY